MSGPLGPVGLACLIPPETDQATIDRQFADITAQYEE